MLFDLLVCKFFGFILLNERPYIHPKLWSHLRSIFKFNIVLSFIQQQSWEVNDLRQESLKTMRHLLIKDHSISSFFYRVILVAGRWVNFFNRNSIRIINFIVRTIRLVLNLIEEMNNALEVFSTLPFSIAF